jgi:copper homeostasis protein
MQPTRAVLVEACVDSVVSARHAAAAGAGRLELCANLVEGGVTPSLGMIARVRERVSIPLHVLIRPRGGDFLYDEDEVAVMLRDIADCRAMGVDGVVLGALSAGGAVDREITRRLIDAARPLAVTFHRAFDLAGDAGLALEELVSLGIERVLTSGQARTAEAGLLLLARLVAEAGARITILAGGGIDESNAARIVRETGVREIHVRGSRVGPSRMKFRRDGVTMGKPYQPDEYRRAETDPERVREIVGEVSLSR